MTENYADSFQTENQLDSLGQKIMQIVCGQDGNLRKSCRSLIDHWRYYLSNMRLSGVYTNVVYIVFQT